jgi:2,3-dihydroxy-p-cumate/2,3-dihydroxybenzoate 3,4-dioxygenase
MINLIDIRYCRIGTQDIEEHVRFATDIIGLQLVDRTESAAYVRGDNRDHDICYFKGDPADHTLAFEIEHEEDYEAAAKYLTDTGIEVTYGDAAGCAYRRVMSYFTFHDPTGNKIDLVHRPFYGAEPFHPTRAIGIQEFSHVGIKTSDAPRDEKFWCKHFNFRVNDCRSTRCITGWRCSQPTGPACST